MAADAGSFDHWRSGLPVEGLPGAPDGGLDHWRGGLPVITLHGSTEEEPEEEDPRYDFHSSQII